MIRKTFTIGLLLFVLSACSPSVYRELAETDQNQVELSIRRTECFGQCPVYSARFDLSAAKVFYQGERFVATMGIREEPLSEDQVTEIIKKIEAVRYAELEDVYDHGKRIKQVVHRTEAPEGLSSLEKLLDNVLKVQLGETATY
jgi:hypothetical protein